VVDPLCIGIAKRPARCTGDLARQALPIGADQQRYLVPVGRDGLLGKDPLPGLDARLDRVDERPVQVEDQRGRRGQRLELVQRVELVQRLFRRKR
jgi:hypothetical protein